jgi:hypothetical protein
MSQKAVCFFILINAMASGRNLGGRSAGPKANKAWMERDAGATQNTLSIDSGARGGIRGLIRVFVESEESRGDSCCPCR